MGMWLKFSNPGRNEGIYLSNGGHDAMSHGIAMTYHNGRIKFIFRSKNGNYWTVSNDNVLADKWYHVTVSWKQNRGLHLYINGNLVNTMNLPQRRYLNYTLITVIIIPYFTIVHLQYAKCCLDSVISYYTLLNQITSLCQTYTGSIQDKISSFPL